MSNKLTDNPILVCGCRAMARDGDGNPACAIHGTSVLADEQPRLQGRRARCHYYGQKPDRHAGSCIFNRCERGKPCSCERDSTDQLPFFKYKGEGSYAAAMRCKNCPYHYRAHRKKEEKFKPGKMDHLICDDFEPHGPFEYDEFYCGCGVGWD